MICEFSWGGWPGLGPAADSLSLASPRESKQREGEPGVRSPALRFGVPCAARNRREAQKLGPSALRHLSLLIRRPLRCSARPQRRGAGTSASRDAGATNAAIRSKAVIPSEGSKAPGFPPPSCVGESHRARRKKVRRCLSPKGEFLRAPPGPSNAACPQRSEGTTHPARLSLPTFFGEAKKVGAPPGAHPGQQPKEDSQTHSTNRPSHAGIIQKSPKFPPACPFPPTRRPPSSA